jgi:hypothetical protein
MDRTLNSFPEISIRHIRQPKNRMALAPAFTQHPPLLARVLSAALSAIAPQSATADVNGVEAFPVEVEVNSGWGDTVVVIVGLPDAAVKESRDQVITAITNSGFKFPMGRPTINLAPADVRQQGPSCNPPIAIGMSAANDQIQARFEICPPFCHAPSQCQRFLRRTDTDSPFTVTSIARFTSLFATEGVKPYLRSKMKLNCASRMD